MNDLKLIDIGINAIKVRMDTYLGWSVSDEDFIEGQYIEPELEQLTSRRDDLASMDVVAELKDLHTGQLKALDALIHAYSSISGKKLSEIEGFFDGYFKANKSFEDLYRRSREKHKAYLLDAVAQVHAEGDLFTDSMDQQVFVASINLWYEGKREDSYRAIQYLL